MVKTLQDELKDDIKLLTHARHIAQAYSVCESDRNQKRLFTITYKQLGVIVEDRKQMLEKVTAADA